MLHYLLEALNMGLKLKTKDPEPCLSQSYYNYVFLGLEIDAISVLTPSHKVSELMRLITTLLNRQKVSLHELQSLVGKLNLFGQATRSSRAFLCRIYDAMLPLKKPCYMFTVRHAMTEDLSVGLYILEHFNWVTYIQEKA
jgi:hypothetical protein